MTGDAP